MADLKWLARLIFQETLAAIDIAAVMQRKVRVEGAKLRCGEIALDLNAFSRIRVVAIGKAAHAMLDGLRATLPADLSFDGIVSAPTSPAQALPGIKYFVGGHPIPNGESWNSAEAILSLLAECDESTLVFFLLSGGGSALSEFPLDSRLSLGDVQQFYRTWVTCGGPISARQGMANLLHHARLEAEANGSFTRCERSPHDWPVDEAAAELLGQLSALQAANATRRVAIIPDGEVPSRVTGKRIGGSNSALVL